MKKRTYVFTTRTGDEMDGTEGLLMAYGLKEDKLFETKVYDIDYGMKFYKVFFIDLYERKYQIIPYHPSSLIQIEGHHKYYDVFDLLELRDLLEADIEVVKEYLGDDPE